MQAAQTRGFCGGVFSLVLLLAALPSVAQADALDEVLASGKLLWGADEGGGAPFAYPDPADNSRLLGFEKELLDLVAAEMSRAFNRPIVVEHRTGNWETLPLLVNQRTIHLAANGFEQTPEKVRDFRCSRPYFVYGLQLLVRRDSPIASWDDLYRTDRRPAKVAVLRVSAAEKYLSGADRAPGAPLPHVEVVGYDGNIDAMGHTIEGVVDATLQDDVIANYYLARSDRFKDLRLVGMPVRPGYYTALFRKGEERLAGAFDAALGRVIANRGIKELYDRWEMDGQFQELALRDVAEVPPARQSTLTELLTEHLPLLLRASLMTVFLAVVSMPLAIALGIMVAVGRLYGPWWIAWPLGVYVEVLRGTPLMLQLYALFFLLPQVGPALPPLVAAIAGLAINYSAYESEIYRAGLQAIPPGQLEAALALGMSRRQAIWRIVLPQAVRIVIPPVTNDFIALFKDTSVCSVVTVMELTKQYSALALSTGGILEMAGLTAALYLLMSYPLSVAAAWNERRLAGGAEGARKLA